MPVKGGFGLNKPNTQNNEQETPCKNITHIINKFGVTYYKISDKNEMYGEDNTQDGCLNPNQIDANFNFLHGDDIKKGNFDKDKKVLILDRFFCDKDMAKYAKTHPSIGPIKISTEHLFDGTYINDSTLYLNFNGDITEIPGIGQIYYDGNDIN